MNINENILDNLLIDEGVPVVNKTEDNPLQEAAGIETGAETKTETKKGRENFLFAEEEAEFLEKERARILAEGYKEKKFGDSFKAGKMRYTNSRRMHMRKGKFVLKNRRYVDDLTEVEKAWLAGMADGYKIRYYIHSGYKISNNVRYNHVLFAMDFTTGSEEIAKRFHSLLGQKPYYRKPNEAKKIKPLYIFRIQSQNAVNVINAISKYSHCREDHLNLVLGICERPEDWGEKDLKIHMLKMQMLNAKTRERKNRQKPNEILVNSWPKAIRESYLAGYRNMVKYTEEEPVELSSNQFEEIGNIFL